MLYFSLINLTLHCAVYASAERTSRQEKFDPSMLFTFISASSTDVKNVEYE